MHLISLPTKPCKSVQNFVLALILTPSRFRFRRNVPSFPLLSKSRRRITSEVPSFSNSMVDSRNDLPPDFTVKILPLIPNSQRACVSFLPSTTIGFPFDDSSASLAMICWIFASLSLSFVDTLFYLVILACRTVSKQSLASLLFTK